jgi:hypothetical protein
LEIVDLILVAVKYFAITPQEYTDDKTLVAEGSDVYVNTAQALSLIQRYLICPSHPAIVKTDSRVDYTSRIFEGDKLSVIN